MFPLGIPARLSPLLLTPHLRNVRMPPRMVRDFDAHARSLGNNCMHASKSRYRGFVQALVSFSLQAPRHAAGPLSARACGRFSRPSSDKHEGHNVLARAHRERRAHSVSRSAHYLHITLCTACTLQCTPRAMHTAMHTAMSDAHTIHIPIHTN